MQADNRESVTDSESVWKVWYWKSIGIIFNPLKSSVY